MSERLNHWKSRCPGFILKASLAVMQDGMLHMMFKLGQCAENKWRQLRGFDYLGKVIKGVQFKGSVEGIANEQVAA